MLFFLANENNYVTLIFPLQGDAWLHAVSCGYSHSIYTMQRPCRTVSLRDIIVEAPSYKVK